MASLQIRISDEYYHEACGELSLHRVGSDFEIRCNDNAFMGTLTLSREELDALLVQLVDPEKKLFR